MRTQSFLLDRLIRRATAGALVLCAALAVTLSGCSETVDPVTPMVLPPLSRIVIALGADTTVVADTLNLGGGLTFSATIRDTGNAVVNAPPTWTSSNPAVFTVNSAGGVSGVGEGSARLYASAGNVADSVSLLVLSTVNGWVVQVSNSSRTLNDVYFQADGAHGVAVGATGEALYTANGGGTWSRRTSGTSYNLNGVWFTTPSEGWAVGNSGAILKTVDGGLTWAIRSSGVSDNLMDVVFATPDTGWAVGSNGTILRTFNRGVTWSKQSPTGFVLNSVSFFGTREGWAVGDNGVICSTVDRGLNWTVVTPFVTSLNLRNVRRLSTLGAVAVGQQGAALYTVDNAGSPDWITTNVGAANDLNGVFVTGGSSGFACGANGTGIILSTIDGGVNWNPQVAPTGNPLNAIWFVDGNRGWAVGVNGRILHTSNGGQP